MTDFNHPILNLAKTLIDRPSVTPDDCGCQDLINQILSPMGFIAEDLSHNGVTNHIWRYGHGTKCFAFVGHTDVVPPGPVNAWSSPPFEATLTDGLMYGRGAADMKGNIAAFIVALKNFIARHPNPNFELWVMLTSDEEGPSIDGVRHMVEVLSARSQTIDFALVSFASGWKTLIFLWLC